MLLNAWHLSLVLGEKLAEWGFMDAQAFCECGMFAHYFSQSLSDCSNLKQENSYNKLYNQGQIELQ